MLWLFTYSDSSSESWNRGIVCHSKLEIKGLLALVLSKSLTYC